MITRAALLLLTTGALTGTMAFHHPLPSLRKAVGPLYQVWSNPQDTEDYLTFASGRGPKELKDQASVIVGKGKLATMWKQMGKGDDVLVGRGEEIPMELPGGVTNFPIYLCVPAVEVESIVRDVIPRSKRNDVVFMQTEFMEEPLKRVGMARKEITNMVPYFKVSPIGKPIDFLFKYDTYKQDGEPKYVGETVVCGKWRGAVKERLERAGMYCKALDYNYLRKYKFEKLIFDTVYPLLSAIHGGLTCGEVSERHYEEVSDMSKEMARATQLTLAVALLGGTDERLVALGRSERLKFAKPIMVGPEDPLWEMRNGFWVELARPFLESGLTQAACTGMHQEYLDFYLEKIHNKQPA